MISVRADFLIVPLTLAVLAGCAGADAGTRAVVRDSAGITIVENSAAVPSEWTLAEAAEVAIGVLEGPQELQLFRVSGAARLPDGRIVITNGGTNEIRFFDESGQYLTAAGRDGEGPGEFRAVGEPYLAADSLLVADSRLLRVSVLSLDGRFARSFGLPRLDEQSFFRLSGAFGDGTLLLRSGPVFFAGEVASGLSRDSSSYYLMDREGSIVDTLGTFPSQDSYVHAEGRSMSVTSLLFGRSASTAAAGQRFYYGSGDSYEIRIHGVDGALERIVRVDRPPRAVTAADIERGKAQRLDGDIDPAWRARSERMLADMPIPSAMPAFSSFKVDAEGNLWVGSYRAPGDESTSWTVFDADGRLLAEVETPPRFGIFQIGPDWVLGRRTDEFEVERVELYHLDRRGS